MSITGVLGRGWGSPTDWSVIDLRNNGKYLPDQQKLGSQLLRINKELRWIGFESRWSSKLGIGLCSRSHIGKELYGSLELPQELSRVHHTFHVSNLKKCYTDKPLVMPLKGIHVDDKLQFVEKPVEIMEREIKRLKRSQIPVVIGSLELRRGSLSLPGNVNKARGAQIHWGSLFGKSQYSPFELVAYTDSDNAGETQDRKSTTGGCLFLGNKLIPWHVKRGRDTKIPQSSGPLVKVGDEAVHKELGDRMERAATTASSLEAECQDTILGDVDAQTRFETTFKQSNDPPLSRGYTLRSGEDSMKLLELMELCTKLSNMLHKNRKSDLIRYALTVNPIIYTSCIQQFWAKENTVNGERQLQALVDKKRVIIMESSVRSDLHLEDAGGTGCLPTAIIFEELARMG
ncbi:putative reverse transcriptase domain-containing protein, partial [Tanacetum coccineum]